MKEPASLSELVPGFREDLESAIMRCLRKEPDRRWQHVSDLRITLEEIRDELAVGRASRYHVVSAAVRPQPAIGRRQLLPYLAGGLAAGAAGGAFLGRSLSRREPVTFTRLTYRRGDVNAARFAPDGSIIYSANWEGSPYSVYSLRPGNRESRPLGLGSSTKLAGVSSTNELAILLAAKNVLARVPISGGTPRELLESVLEADWSPDARQLAVVRKAGNHHRLEYPIGTVLYESGAAPMRPRISPDGGSVAFFEVDYSVGDVALKLVRAGETARVVAGGMRAVAGLAWALSGKEIWISAIRQASDNPAIFAVSLQGQMRLLTQSANWLSIHDVSAGGELLVASTLSRVGIRGLLPGEHESRDLSWHENSSISQMTADGSLLMLELGAGEGRNNAIFYRRPGEGAVRLGDGNYPALSPDGKSVVCVRRDEDRAVLQIIPTGAGETRVFLPEGFRYQQPEWFPDGQRILFNAARGDGAMRGYTASAAGGSSTPITPAGVRVVKISPDGNWMVALSAGKGAWLQSVTGEAAPRPIPGLRADDIVLAWTSAGDGLLIRCPLPPGDQTAIERLSLSTGVRTRLHQVGVPEPGDTIRREFVVADDGRAYAFSFQRDLASLYLVRGVEPV